MAWSAQNFEEEYGAPLDDLNADTPTATQRDLRRRTKVKTGRARPPTESGGSYSYVEYSYTYDGDGYDGDAVVVEPTVVQAVSALRHRIVDDSHFLEDVADHLKHGSSGSISEDERREEINRARQVAERKRDRLGRIRKAHGKLKAAIGSRSRDVNASFDSGMAYPLMILCVFDWVVVALLFVLIGRISTNFALNVNSEFERVPTAQERVKGFQIGAVVVLLVCSVFTFVTMGLKAESPSQITKRVTYVMLVKGVSVVCDLVLFAFPRTSVLVVVSVSVLLHVIELSLAGVIWTKAQKRAQKGASFVRHTVGEEVHELHPRDRKIVMNRYNQWLDLRRLRREVYTRMTNGRSQFLLICGVACVLLIINFFLEYRSIVSSQGEFFRDESLDLMTNPAGNLSAANLFHGNRSFADNRVVIVLFDGFRVDALTRNDELRELLGDETFAVDAKQTTMRVQLPTMSVPNWVVTLTGTKPETSGVLGNLLIPETSYDSIYAKAKEYGVHAGVTASPWMADIIKSTLPFLSGDGTIDAAFGTTLPTSDIADKERAKVALFALTREENPYGLFLAHFSDIDKQGHEFGVDVKYNKRDSYFGAVTNKTRIFKDMIDAIDPASNTVVILLSDHGHVDRGGHGGTDEVLVNVPLVFYKKGSGLRDLEFEGPRFDPEHIENVDIAPTVAALLGMPVPRQNQGRFIDMAMNLLPQNESLVRLHYRDLFQQKQLLLQALGIECGCEVEDDDNLLSRAYPDETAAFYRDGVETLLDMYEDVRQSQIAKHVARNVLLAFVLTSGFFVVTVAVFQGSTFGDVTSLCGSPFERNLKWRKMYYSRLNREAFVWSLVSLALYYLVDVGLFLVINALVGYTPAEFQSTLIHTPSVVPRYVAAILIPSIGLEWLNVRFYTFWNTTKMGVVERYEDPDPIHPTKPTAASKRLAMFQNFAWFINGRFGAVSRYKDGKHALVYLIKHYQMLLTVWFAMVLFVVEGTYTFPIPWVFENPYVNSINWRYRFRCLSLVFMTIPLIVGNWISIYLQPAFRDKDDVYDGVFLLYLWKKSRDEAREAKRHNRETESMCTTGNTFDEVVYSAYRPTQPNLVHVGPGLLEETYTSKFADHAKRDMTTADFFAVELAALQSQLPEPTPSELNESMFDSDGGGEDGVDFRPGDVEMPGWGPADEPSDGPGARDKRGDEPAYGGGGGGGGGGGVGGGVGPREYSSSSSCWSYYDRNDDKAA